MTRLKKILSYPLSVVFYIALMSTFIFSHIVQWLTFNIGGYQPHKKSSDYLGLMLLGCLRIIGTKITFINKQNLPKDVPIIFVCNHQSIYDISPIQFYLRKYHPKFVAKIELGKGLPGISYNLRHGGSILIDRNKPKESIRAIMNFGKYIEKYNRSAVIFPEGTRSRDGVPNKFSENGVKMLIRYSPSSYVVPISINNSWKLSQIGDFPLNLGVNMIFEVHEPVKSGSIPFEELFDKTENKIKESIIYY